MEKKMKDIYADQINAGTASYSMRAFRSDLLVAIANDKDLKDKPLLFYFSLYFDIIYMFAAEINNREIIDLLIRQYPEVPMNTINPLIRRVKSEYRDFVELLTAIIYSKLKDFAKLGASV